ncbi:ciliary neurotrophic factor receptor subunit alpha-like [Salvelinus sp. IW2-2015]|uniref:ciliary neurotrophic factor receptor subunit alpha-like n=1 Tax=Salvelinus sp. IW2-2015 TaxID=2691554 RepID=UPI000CEAFEA8|nr:ciliary neurotrophic factor receptor subunit alpha-like [Salvelinus alpinus]
MENFLVVELSDSTAHTITDAYAGKEYIIQVAAKDMEIGTWSDWSVAVQATPWMDEPKQITSTTEQEPLLDTTPSPAPPSAEPHRAGVPVDDASSTLLSPLLWFSCCLLLGALM